MLSNKAPSSPHLIISAADYCRLRCIDNSRSEYLRLLSEAGVDAQGSLHVIALPLIPLSFSLILAQDDAPVLSVPCFFSQDEEFALDALFDKVMDFYEEDSSIRIAAASPDLELEWQRVFRGELEGIVAPENILTSKEADAQIVAKMKQNLKPEPPPNKQPKPKQRQKPTPKPQPEPVPEPQPEPASKPQPEPAPKPTPEPEPKPPPKPEPKPEPKPPQKPEPKPEPNKKAKTETKPAPKSKPENNEKPNKQAETEQRPPNLQTAARLLLDGNSLSVPPVTGIIELLLLLTQNEQWAETLALTKALSLTNINIYKTINRRFEYALDLHHEQRIYSSEKLRFLNTDIEELGSVLPDEFLDYTLWATLSVACFAPAVKYDRELESKAKQAINEMENKSNVGELKSVFTCLMNLLKDHPSGFSRRALQTLLNNEDRKSKIAAVQLRAGNLQTPPNLLVRMDGVGRLRDELFGSHSDLSKTLNIIAVGSESKKDEVTDFYNRFCGDQTEQSAYDDEKIRDYINEKWTKVRDTRSAKALEHNLYDKAYNNIERRLEVIGEWLDLTAQSVDNPESMRRHAELVSSSIRKTIAHLDESLHPGIRAGHAILRHTLNKQLNTLSGKEDERISNFIPLLATPYIGLDDQGHPHFYEELNELPGCEPWRLALKTIANEKVDPETAIAYINDPDNVEWFSNYGTADWLQSSAITNESKRVDYSKSVKFAEDDANREIEKTSAYLDLNFMNGCIEEQTREAAEAFIDGFKDAVIQSRDFARLHMFLREIRKWVEMDRDKISQGLICRLDVINAAKEPTAVAIIRDTIKNGLLSASEDYINRLESGDSSFTEEARMPVNPGDILDVFLSKYKLLYNECRIKRDHHFIGWAYASVTENCAGLISNPDEWIKQNGKSCEEFIKSWLTDTGNQTAKEERITKLLKRIFGLLVRKVSACTAEGTAKSHESYEITTMKALKNRADYEHPISLFGTDVPTKIKVVPLYGATTAEQVYARVVNDMRLDGDAIVIVDGALSLDERKELARRFKPRMSGTIIVLDRVLMLYLAMLEEQERLRALLICSLPYAYYRPYSNDGAAVTDEMFMGRKSELSDIRNAAGACLVYGGRQLGKTALLSRACSIEHNPEQNEYAVRIDIENIGVKNLAKKLSSELASCGIDIDPGGKVSVASICEELSRQFRNGKIKKLLLALDEADQLLDEDRQDKYKVLQQFVNLRQQTTNRFKCVFAGLHNVMRSRDAIADNNSPLAKLGKPLCIKPLSHSDAQQLVLYPLAYLGYKISNNQLATILSATINYPGIIHLFCYELIKDVSEKHNSYYAGVSPPFVVDDKVLGGVISSASLKDRVRDKIHMTLRMDDRYWKLANSIALLCYEKQGSNDDFSVGEIISETGKFFDNMSNLSPDFFATLLDEMCAMGILNSANSSGETLYRFRKNQFLRMVGSEDEVMNVLVEG